MTQDQQSNLQAIFQDAQKNQSSLFKLMDIGRKTGFDNFINRKQIWPFLLELDTQKIKEAPVYEWKEGMKKNSFDYEQLQKDADRSLSSMKTFESITKFHLKKKQEAVLAVLDSFFAKNQDLKYIQGFHDVASVFLILFGNSTGYYLMEKSGRTYFHDFLTIDFGKVGRSVSQIVYELVTTEDPEFRQIFSSYEQTKLLIFIVPWLLTWFSHNFSSIKTICRIWDYLLCTGPHGVFYLTAGIILSTKQDLKANCEDIDEPSIQMYYQQQAKNQTIDINAAIEAALALQLKIDVVDLQGYRTLEPNSTFRLQNFNQHFQNIQKYRRHRKEQQRRQKNISKALKVTAGFIAITVLVIGASYMFNHGKLKNISQF